MKSKQIKVAETEKPKIVERDSKSDNSSKGIFEVGTVVKKTTDLLHSENVVATTSVPFCNQQSKLAQKIIKNRSLPLLLGVMIAVTFAGHAYIETQTNEENLQRHRASAELMDYAQKPEQAYLMWHEAILDAKKLNFKEKLTADMYAKAASSESRYVELIWQKHPVSKNSPEELERVKSIVRNCRQQQKDDLKAALKIYKQIPDTTAEQFVTLEKLEWRLGDDISEMLPGETLNRFIPVRKTSEQNGAEKDLKQGLSDLKSSQSDLGLAAFQRYLRKTRNSFDLTDPIMIKVSKTNRKDYKTLQLLVPIIHELIYYNQGDVIALRNQYECLDYLLSSFMNPKNFNDRLNAAEASQTTHGVIIEYQRCLGIKNDESVRSKLIAKIVEARKDELTNEEKAEIAEYTDCLLKLKALTLEAFGNKHRSTYAAYQALGVIYAKAGDFAQAELFLDPNKSKVTSDEYDQADLAYELGSVYAAEGKFELALASYRRGQALDHKPDAIPRYGIWQEIARINLMAGHIKESDKAMKEADKESSGRGPALTGSGVDTLLMEQQ